MKNWGFFHGFFAAFALGQMMSEVSLAELRIQSLAPQCSRAGITTVTFQRGKISSSDSAINFCEAYPSRLEFLASHFRAHLIRIAAIHDRLEAMTGFRLAQLLDRGLHLNFRIDPKGPYISYYDPEAETPTLTLGLFHSLTNEFNAGTYTHEFGHVLTDALQRSGHPMGSVARHLTLNEGLSDLLAYTVHGAVMTEDGGLRGCFLDDRNYRMMLTYRGSALRFSVALPAKTLERCCIRTRAGSELSPEEIGVCREADHPDSLEWVNQIVGRFKDTRLQTLARLSPRESSELRLLLDPHQLGLPWFTWVVDLARKEGQPPYVFMERFFRENDPPMLRMGQCRVLKGAAVQRVIDVAVPSMRRLVDAISARYPSERPRLERFGFGYGSDMADQLELQDTALVEIWKHRHDAALAACFPGGPDGSQMACELSCEFPPETQD